jgi:parallel beta-helix repeat protein
MLAPLSFAIQPVAAANVCSPAGTTGLTTLMTAHSGQVISGLTINAKGCDVGIFVPPGSKHVVITGNTIRQANVHGIFVQDSTYVTVDHNKVVNNSAGLLSVSCDFIAPPCINEGKAIQLSGVSHSVVSDNYVANDLYGGIAVTDDGPVDPGAFNPGSSLNAVDNVVSGNYITRVSNDCGIVVAVYNAQTANGNTITGNTVLGSPPPFGVNPYVGQIVVATDGPGATIRNTAVSNNVVVGSTLPGIVVHSNAPSDKISYTSIVGNKLGNNGYYPSFFATTNTPVQDNGTVGISLVAEAYPPYPGAPILTHTTLVDNTVSPDQVGVWLCNTGHTSITSTPGPGSHVTTGVLVCSHGGS